MLPCDQQQWAGIQAGDGAWGVQGGHKAVAGSDSPRRQVREELGVRGHENSGPSQACCTVRAGTQGQTQHPDEKFAGARICKKDGVLLYF